MVEYEICEGKPSEEMLNILESLQYKCFGKVIYNRSRMLIEYELKAGIYTILALSNSRYVGFKTGYTRRDKQFHSWLGGVIPESRRSGIASELMNRLHEHLISRNYEKVRTQTGNEYRSMLLLNIKLGYDVIGTYVNGKNQIRITLEKKI